MAENLNSALLISELLNQRKEKKPTKPYSMQILSPQNHSYLVADEQGEKVLFLFLYEAAQIL